MTTPKIDFEESTHTYRVNGVKFTSVTQALSIVDTRWKEPYYLMRGKYFHRAAELYDLEELDESTVDPAIAPYLSAYKVFLMDTGFIPRLIEHRIIDEGLRLAGTLDRAGYLNGKESIIDLKTGTPNPVDDLQGAAYWRMYGNPGAKFFDLYLKADGGYRLRELEKPRLHWPTFAAILTTYRWMEENNGSRANQ